MMAESSSGEAHRRSYNAGRIILTSWKDPQQRKMLEVVYECFESAGKSLEDMSGSETACYVGSFKDEHSDNLWSHDTGLIIPYHSTVGPRSSYISRIHCS